MVLVVTGTNNTTYQVIAPLVPKMYVVTNNTTGGNSITIGASTGSVITIPNGVTAQVYCDGSTGFYSAQTGSAGNFLINGNLSVTGNLVDVGSLTGSTITASNQFSGPGTGLTGTASSLTTGSANTLTTTNFSISESGGKLYIYYQGTPVASISSTGAIVSASTITPNGTP